jgi:isoleucyl-tRNA synthetase
MKGDEGVKEQILALNTLFDVLLNTSILMSSITPFLSEFIYQNLRNGICEDNTQYQAKSIHFLGIPEANEDLINERIEKMVSRMQQAIEIGRKLRDENKISIRFPLRRVTIVE